MHKCPHPDCDIQMPFHILACKPHWFMLPQELRSEINMTWRRFDNAAYLAARQRAVDFWNSKAKPEGKGQMSLLGKE